MKWDGQCYREWPPAVNGVARCGFWMCVHKRNVGCTYIVSIYTSVYLVCGNKYTGFQNWTSPCLMYIHGSSILIFLNVKILIRKMFHLKVEKRLWFLKKLLFKAKFTPMGLFSKSLPSFGMKLKWGINIIILNLLASTKICLLSENSIFIAFPIEKDFEKTFILFTILLYVSVGQKKKRPTITLI